MNREEAITRLVILKFFHRVYDEKTDKAKWYILGKNVSAEAMSRLDDANLTYLKKGNKFFVHEPYRAMEQLKDIEPFKNLFENYRGKFVTPEKIFEIVENSQSVAWNTYFLPITSNNTIRILGEVYSVEKKEEDEKRVYMEVKSKSGKIFKVLLERYDERPPFRGLMVDMDNVRNVSEEDLWNATRVVNLSHVKFPDFTIPQWEGIINGTLYSLSRKVSADIVLGKDERSTLVETIVGDMIISKEIDEIKGEEDLNKLRQFIKSKGFDSLSRDAFREFLSEENKQLDEAENVEEKEEEENMNIINM